MNRIIEGRVADEIDVIDIRTRARQLAIELSFPSAKCYRVATAVSELANNLHCHATAGGTIRLRSLEAGRTGIEVVAEDQGPGIADIALAMTDGYSTSRGLGAGLPGVRRLCDDFEIHSTPGIGTRVVARFWK